MTKLFLALDYDFMDDAINMANKVNEHIDGIKIGLELTHSIGLVGIQEIYDEVKKPLFLDLKLHDIPTTVGKTINAILNEVEPELMTIHMQGGRKMCEYAMAAANGYKAKIIGVTQLTSLSEDDLEELGCPTKMYEKTIPLASEWGIDGIVCTPQAAIWSKNQPIYKVVPGIRLSSKLQDQVSVSTPHEISGIANVAVVGREITQSKTPIETAMNIKQLLMTNEAN